MPQDSSEKTETLLPATISDDSTLVCELTAKLKVDYMARCQKLARKFKDSKTNTRELLQIHKTLTLAEGRDPTAPKDTSSDNALERLTAAAAFGASAGASLRDGRLPPVRATLPEDQGQAWQDSTDEVVAAPGDVLGRPPKTDKGT